MANLPLYINNQLIGVNELTGQNYVNGYPELMQQLILHMQNPAFGYASAPCFVYPLPGKQKIWAIAGRSWFPGQRLRAYRFGNSADWRTVMVHAYNYLTGELSIEVVATSTFETQDTAATGYWLSPYFSEPIGAAVVTVAAGGTGAGDIDTLRKNLLLPTNKNYDILFADFINPNSFARQIFNSVDKGAAWLNAKQLTPLIDYQNHPGVLLMQQCSLLNDVEIVALGRPYDLIDWADMSGDDTVFEADILIPALSTSGNFQIEVGLIGPTAKLLVLYKDTLNSGKFQIITGVSSTFATFNSLITVAINTWYKINISISGANVSIQVNGAGGTTVAKAAFQGVSAANRMTPMVRVTQAVAAGINGICYVDYLYFRRHFANGR